MRRAWLCVSAVATVGLAGCGLDTGPGREWVAVTTIEGALAAEIGRASSTPEKRTDTYQPTHLRVVTWNVHLGADPTLLADQIRGNPALASADLFLFQEEEAYPGEGSTRASRLAARLGLAWIYVPGRMKGEGTHGLAMMSRYPLDQAALMMLPATDDWKPRIAIFAEVVVGAVRVPVVDVHLETRINVTDRILQLRPAVIDLPDAAIVAGDVNTNPYLWEEGEVPLVPTAQIVDTDQAPVLDDYMRQIGFATPAADVGPTHRMYGIESRLDAIFVRGFAASTATVERGVVGSDHWPVWVDVAL